MIHYNCPRCGTKMESPDSMAGGTEKCSSCDTEAKVPGDSATDHLASDIAHQGKFHAYREEIVMATEERLENLKRTNLLLLLLAVVALAVGIYIGWSVGQAAAKEEVIAQSHIQAAETLAKSHIQAAREIKYSLLSLRKRDSVVADKDRPLKFTVFYQPELLGKGTPGVVRIYVLWADGKVTESPIPSVR